MVKLSIIIPTKNIPDLLDRCISSIPDNDDIQVIAIDDNSSPEIVDFEHYPLSLHKNVELIRTYEGKGAGYARNVGLSVAKGRWLLFADSDDYFAPNFYAVINRYIDSSADMILFKAESVDSDTLMPANRNENINKRIDEFMQGKITAKEASIAVQSPWCRLIRNDFVKKNNILFDEVLACNDTMFTTKVTCLSELVEVSPEVIYVVTQRSGSLWATRTSNPKNYLTRLKVQIKRNKYVKQYGFKQIPIILYLIGAWKNKFTLFLRALWIVLSKGALFQGLRYFFKDKFEN